MDLDKHRAILYCGFKRCYDLLPELQKDTKETGYQKTFYPLWLGNWLTDMSQAAAFFSLIPTDKTPQGQSAVRYWLTFLQKVHAIFHDQWLKRYIDRIEGKRKLADHAKKKEKVDYYQSRKDGAYVLPDFIVQNADFKKTWENLFAALWQEEWTSAEKAWEASQQMGEMPESLPIEIPVDETGAFAITPGEAEDIGAYYPLDHFDVTDQYIVKQGERILDNREELELKGYEKRGFMTTTAQEALEYTKQDWIKKAFDTTQEADRSTTRQKRLTNYHALKLLGHGLHTLQDFYAHSNYTDLLLICMAEKNLLTPYWNKRIQYLATETEVGTFNAFVLCKDHPDDRQGSGEKTPVVTGRFDTIDTVHTLLHLSIQSIHIQDDKDSGKNIGGDRDDKEKQNRIFRLLFGTFSDIDVVQNIKGTVDAYRNIAEQIDEIQDKIADFFMDYIVDPFVKTTLKGQASLINTYLLLKDATLHNDKTLEEYRKAGEMLYHQNIIERHLRNTVTEAEQADKIILPHHALLAKDHDKGNDAVKLSYKLSCALATEMTTEVLVKYFQGATFSELEPLLERRYVHPQFHREQCARTGSLNRTIQALQGKWFHHSVQTPENGQSILGFDMNTQQHT